MNSKSDLDLVLRRVYFLTSSLKKLTNLHDYTKNVRTNLVIKEMCNEYKIVSDRALELLASHIQEERSRGIIPLEYIRIYRNLGAKDE